MAERAPEFLGDWMTRQRWYANKGASAAIEEIGSWWFAGGSGGARPDGTAFVTHLVIDHAVGKPALYQVPLSYRDEPVEALAHALVGTLDDGRSVYDATHDPAWALELLAMVGDGATGDGNGVAVRGEHVADAVSIRPTSSRVLSGEQSNTSIIFEGGERPVICKVFRALHDGDNPDVELQSALAAAGSHAVPPPIGHLVGEWRDSGTATGRATGHLAFAQEFLPGVQDAWRVALEAAQQGRGFESEAAAMGAATADVHARLASALSTAPATPAHIAATLDQMRSRLALAIAEAPDLAGLEAPVLAVLERAAAAAWPAQQRIHGDLHLGQVLAVPDGTWVIVDFEGEPLRPMHERRVLDSPLRDVAGMLRSFDYVAGTLEAADPSSHDAARTWADSARAAFLGAYASAAGRDLDPALLEAFELDKALYEAVYEARNRPDWLGIPVTAVRRLATRAR
jgi:trehalose synthase-fused probable maltokinase